MTDPLRARLPRARIGVLPTGHRMYWGQFPSLRERCLGMWATFRERLETLGEVVAPELVDTPERAEEAGALLRGAGVDLVYVFPLGYTTGMVVAPAVRQLDVPLRLLNAHLDASYDYASADTAEYLYHEGPCCLPEYAATLITLGKSFRVTSGHFGQPRLWAEIEADCRGAAAARVLRGLNYGILGGTYTGMTDMPTDEHRLLRLTGKLPVRPEVEEIEEAFRRVSEAQLEDMYRELRATFAVDETVTNEHLQLSAQIAVAFAEVVERHDLGAFGYYWWGEKEEITQLRAQSALAVTRLTAQGRPGVTEGDLKTAMAMKLLDLLGAGGMFVEFFAVDWEEEFVLVGHDGPANPNVAESRPRLQHLGVHHGKTGHGLGLDFSVRPGPVTLVNLSQFGPGEDFRLLYTVGEVLPGPVLNIGNPNCRVRLERPLEEFFEMWCQAGPAHHLALGLGDVRRAVEVAAEALGCACVRV